MTARRVTSGFLLLIAASAVACGGSSDGTDEDQAASRPDDTQASPTPTAPINNDNTPNEPSAPAATDSDDDTPTPENTTPSGTPDNPSPIAPTPVIIVPIDDGRSSCEDLPCGAACGCPAGASCLVIAEFPGVCNADGQCLVGADPACPGSEPPSEDDCTSSCPVPKICQQCGDGCAEAFVPCNADGSCGEIEWLCDDSGPTEPVEPEAPPQVEPEAPPVEPEAPPQAGCPGDCSVPLICQVCDDGTCAAANVSCNEDGSCGDIAWECNGEPAVEPEPSPGQYDPCADKSDGDSCSLCPPNDPACSEIDVLKTCQNGECLPGAAFR